MMPSGSCDSSPADEQEISNSSSCPSCDKDKDNCKDKHFISAAAAAADIVVVEDPEWKLSVSGEEEVVEEVVAIYNQAVEKNKVWPPNAMDLSDIMEPVRDFGGQKKGGGSGLGSGSKSSVLLTIENLHVIKKQSAEYSCVFCKSGEVDETHLGRLYFRNGVVIHYFCMLFSAALSQKGKEDREGILGFLVEDIMKEVRRSFRLKCTYCHKTGASVGCCTRKCKAAYHYSCGLENGVNFQFYGNFQTYCIEHRNFQKIPSNQTDWTCPICLCEVGKNDLPNSATLASCCKNIFHRSCLQRMALSAGYFFKCPTCNDREKFVKEMRAFGIYVPQQDASWEKDNAFQDLYVQYSNCDASNCLCPKGREFNSDKGDWILARCRLCGGTGTHKRCSHLKTVTSWACAGCTEVEKSTAKSSTSIRPAVAGCSSSSSSAAAAAMQQETDSDDEVDLTAISLRSSAAEYFPFDREKKCALDDNGTNSLRDWRSLTLRVNLCNMMGRAGQVRPPPPPVPAPAPRPRLRRIIRKTISKKRRKIANENTQQQPIKNMSSEAGPSTSTSSKVLQKNEASSSTPARPAAVTSSKSEATTSHSHKATTPVNNDEIGIDQQLEVLDQLKVQKAEEGNVPTKSGRTPRNRKSTNSRLPLSNNFIAY